ncbi:phosphonate metabolism protein/1,5-bisphosphokinase (PRPP-forming) PhnN [Martelella sp. FLE1502]
MIVVVGPSGAGKDSVINYAATVLRSHPRFAVVRRVITRPSDHDSEIHETMTPDAFAAKKAVGDFAVSWSAHGLDYGIPAEHRAFVANGGVALCNGSRKALDDFRSAFARLTVVNVTARPEILAARLAARGRESAEQIAARLARSTMAVHGDFDVVTIDNSDALETAGDRLVALIRESLEADEV